MQLFAAFVNSGHETNRIILWIPPVNTKDRNYAVKLNHDCAKFVCARGGGEGTPL